ncbi:MAG: hypothetical protein ACI4KF_10275 [Huintestinicola sp.]
MFSSSIKRKAAGFLAAVMAISTFNSFPINIAAEEETENTSVVFQTAEDDTENAGEELLSVFEGSESENSADESIYDVSFMGTVEYAGDDSWSKVTRPANFDSSVMELYAVMADGSEKKLDLQATNFSGNIYMQFVDGDDGGGTFTVTKAPSKLDGVDVSSYRLYIPKSEHYSEVSVGISADGRAVLTLNAITTVLKITKKVPGGVDAKVSFPVNIILKVDDVSVTLNKTLTLAEESETASVEVTVPVGVLCYAIEKLNSGSGYKLSSYSLSSEKMSYTGMKDSIPFVSEENSEYFIEIINARYNTSVSWTVKWVDNNASSGRDPRFTLMYSLNGGATLPLDESKLELFGLDSVPQAVCSNPTASNLYKYSYSGLPNVVGGKTVTYSVAEEADGYICEYDIGSGTFTNTLAAELNATLKWSDSAVTQARPTAAEVRSLLHLYQCISGVYTDVTDTAVLSVSDDNSEWTITAENPLPRYTSNNQGIEYALVFGTISSDGTVTGSDVPVSGSITEEGLKYVLTYTNGQGTYGNIFDRCYSGGTIVATLSGTCDFEAQLEWLDNDSSTRPKVSLSKGYCKGCCGTGY